LTILKIVGCEPQKGDVGVEIEVEGRRLPPVDNLPKQWRADQDGSLRGESAEYVLRRPLTLPQLQVALEDLETCFDAHDTKVQPTFRAGVHVHINVQELTPKQLVSFICLYFVLEEVLLRYCDKSRLGNHFCLRMSDAGYLLDKLITFITEQNLNLLNDEDIRYASMNLTSLFKYGSVEFRSLESTTDYNKIAVWAGVLTHLRDYAKTLSSPADILGQASVHGFAEYAPVILGPWYSHFRQWATEDNIKAGIRNIQYAIYARDWDKKSLNIFAKSENLFDTP
jgi:hypothetical protein